MPAGPPADSAQLKLSPGERSLAEKADRYRSLFAYIPNGVFSLDLEGHLTEANGALQALTRPPTAISPHRIPRSPPRVYIGPAEEALACDLGCRPDSRGACPHRGRYPR